MNQQNPDMTPLADAILAAVGRERIAFHMPGHLYGRGLPPDLACRFGQLDTTELPDTDDLAHPEGMLRDARNRAAAVFGAARSHLLVNGSTAGILAMVHCVAGPGDVLLVGRDCHRSVLHAIRLAGAEPRFVAAPAQQPGKPPCGPSADDFLRAADRHPEACAVLLTRPNYYGVAAAIDGLASALHRRGMRLLVDEAHGAHFAADPRFPAPALALGADLVVQSLHKTLPSPSQTALLHEGDDWPGVRAGLPVASVSEAVALFQTSSPSWPLLAYADAAVAWLSCHGAAAYDALLARIGTFARMLAAGEGACLARIRLLGADCLPEGYAMDPSRMVLAAPGRGTALERRLSEVDGIVAEMADPDHVVLIATPFHGVADFEVLAAAIAAADSGMPPESIGAANGGNATDTEPLPQRVLPMGAAACRPREPVLLAEAAGRIAAVPVVPYPPGVAAIVPGERFDARLVARLVRMAEAGVSLNGLEQGRCLCVVESGGGS